MEAKQSLHSHKDLVVWQKATRLAVLTYEITGHFPAQEQYGLTSQMRRAAVSISSNIAEGRARGTRKEFIKFLNIAYGSAAELESQIEVAKLLPFGQKLNYNAMESMLIEIMKMLSAMMAKLSQPQADKQIS